MNLKYMEAAILEAKKAFDKNEIPVGCVIVKDGKIIGRGYNLKEKKQNPLLHAELIAIKKACSKIKSWRLNDCDIYITMEPCNMCYFSLCESRISNIYYLIESKNSDKEIMKYQRSQKKINSVELEEKYMKMLQKTFKKMRE